MKPLKLVKFTQSVKVKEESNYFRDQDFIIELYEDRNLISIQDRRSGNKAWATIYNCIYFWEKEPEAVAAPVEAPAPTKKKS